MSYINKQETYPIQKGPKTVYLTPEEMVIRCNTISEEANRKIEAAQTNVEYWYGIAEELSQVNLEQTLEIERLEQENKRLIAKIAKLNTIVQRKKRDDDIEESLVRTRTAKRKTN